jgi:16S rRNA (adenine1518-N6/adenine1519-N6)-dimethyltransferase
MVATLQIEVAKRLLAKPGTPDYGLLTLLVQLDYEPKNWFKIPASCFFPEPDVDSACACLVRREQPRLLREQRDTFTRIVKRSFSQRRKMMLKLLKEDWPEQRLVGEFERLKLSHQIRAEEVSVEQFTELARGLSKPSQGTTDRF